MGLLKHLQFLVYLTIAIICHFARAGHEITDEPISPDQCTLLTECEELKGLVTEKALENLYNCAYSNEVKSVKGKGTHCPAGTDDVCLCTDAMDCHEAKKLFEDKNFAVFKSWKTCGFNNGIPKYCCPIPDHVQGRFIQKENESECVDYDENGNLCPN